MAVSFFEHSHAEETITTLLLDLPLEVVRRIIHDVLIFAIAICDLLPFGKQALPFDRFVDPILSRSGLGLLERRG
jgi:hypothetical protein